MRSDLDFRTLRAEIEAATLMPDFTELYQRAGRVRRRDRLTVAGALLGTLAVFVPVALASAFGRPAPNVLGPNPDIAAQVTVSPSVAPSTAAFPSTITVRAAAGGLPDGVITAVDVCVEVPQARRCNLQVTWLHAGTAEQRAPFVDRALRQSPLDRLDSVELTRLSPDTFLLSGVVGGASRSTLRLRLPDGPSDAPLAPIEHLPLTGGDRAVQLAQFGDLFGVRRSDGALSLLASQPPLANRSLATAMAPQVGWWVTGADPITGAPGVAVTRDQGQTWITRPLGQLPPGLDVPTVATGDGQLAYAYVRSSKGIRSFRSTDGGIGWTEIKTKIPLPGALAADNGLKDHDLRALVRTDRSVLIWVQNGPETVFLASANGDSYHVLDGPGAPVEDVDNGFASLSSTPQLSTDAVKWTDAQLSATVLPN